MDIINKYCVCSFRPDLKADILMDNANSITEMRLIENNSKMIIGTELGYLIIVNNINLTTFKKDLKDFDPLCRQGLKKVR